MTTTSIYNKVHVWTVRATTCLLLIMLSLPLQAQDNTELYRSIYDKAEQDYDIGRLEQAEQRLKENLKDFPLELKQSAYRMLALCYLGMDRDDDAQYYTKLLLAENPYYSSSINDPQRFIDIVEQIKSGLIATITTASSQAESLNEVPVATTLITEEMIQNSGATNLQEVLATYVPGMTIVDCNDDINIAMRGIYSNGQEKILIMLNGHRLNSYCTNIQAPDFSIGLEKLKQIEVLRGPASSLYGGVALTAVVNLITKQGADIDGAKVKAGVGNYGQLRGDLLIGKRYFDLDLLIWGDLYKANGQNYFIKKEDTGLKKHEGDITVGGIGNIPTYDAGVAVKYKNMKFLYNTHFSQVQAPFTMTNTQSPYDSEKYRTFNGLRPSFSTNSHHVELGYEHKVGNTFLGGGVFYDNSDLTHYQVISEATVSLLPQILPLPDNIKELIKDKGGISRYINGQESTIGGKLQGSWGYVNTGKHKGQLSFGGEFSYFKLNDVRYTFGYDFDKIITETNQIPELGKGHESNANAYVQLKHQWNSFILNAGMRFDYKHRYNDTKIKELSPRVALIYLQPKWNVKLSYSKAFIDAPYLYRKSNSFLEMMKFGKSGLTEDLDPETLHSFQVTLGATQWVKGLNFELNGFYNQAKDLIFLELIDYYNNGDINTYGLEFSGNYNRPRFSANLNVTWQKVKDAHVLDRDENKAFNIPTLSANLVLAWNVTKNLKLHAHANFYSEQTTHHTDLTEYIKGNDILKKLDEYTKMPVTPETDAIIYELYNQLEPILYNLYIEEDISPRVIFNVGASYKFRNLELGLNIRNLLNTKYYQSGMSTGLIPQKGRWFMFDIAYKF